MESATRVEWLRGCKAREDAWQGRMCARERMVKGGASSSLSDGRGVGWVRVSVQCKPSCPHEEATAARQVRSGKG